MNKFKKYRLYIDETGNSDLNSSDNPNHRFLGITGVALDLEYVDKIVFPELENMKKDFFGSHPDEPVILHRKEIVNHKPPFDVLKDKTENERFNKRLLELMDKWEYTVFSVVIDKLEHKNRYTTWQFDPYHYCFMMLLERYVHFLEGENFIDDVKGDVMSESRGSREDIRLKNSFENLIKKGTDFVKPDRFKNVLTSVQLKVKPKSNNISGLQLADIIAHPSRREILKEKKLITDTRDVFGDEIMKIIQSKYYQKNGVIYGYGKKLVP